jgi:Ca-activated chloride channel family protein
LKHVSFEGEVSNFLAKVNISQRFENNTDGSIETEYRFPVDSTSAMVSLIVKLADGRQIAAKVMEKNKAEEKYDDAVSSGNTAYMARRSSSNAMTLSVGNMAPGTSVEIVFTLVFPVAAENEQWKFCLPGAMMPFKEKGAEPIMRSTASFGIDFSFVVTLPSQPGAIESKTHPILSEKMQGTTYLVKVDPDADFKAKSDFEFTYTTETVNVPQCLSGVGGDGKHVGMFSFVPKFLEADEDEDDLEGLGEFIFVLDRSGSMSGTGIKLAR